LTGERIFNELLKLIEGVIILGSHSYQCLVL
jgi:hypothetical protein